MAGIDYNPSRLVGAFVIIILAGALLSISMNLTGNVIGGSSDNNNWISIGLFLLGCLLTFIFFKLRDKKVKKQELITRNSRRKTKKKKK